MVLFFLQQQLTTMFITRCLVFFWLFLLALFLSPFALELKCEVGVWMKLTWWALLLRFIHSMHRLWFRIVQLLQISLCASFCAGWKNKLLILWNLFLPDNFLYCVMCICQFINPAINSWYNDFVNCCFQRSCIQIGVILQLDLFSSHICLTTLTLDFYSLCNITTDGLLGP